MRSKYKHPYYNKDNFNEIKLKTKHFFSRILRGIFKKIQFNNAEKKNVSHIYILCVCMYIYVHIFFIYIFYINIYTFIHII